VAYTSGTSAAAGTAVGVADPSADNTDATYNATTPGNWVQQTSDISATNPDNGTPRAQNDGYVAPASPNRLPLPTNGGTLPRDPIAPARTTSGSGAMRR
jgi:hypothetical protein